MKRLLLALIIGLFISQTSIYSQRAMVEVPLYQRIDVANTIIEGEVVSKNSYWNGSKSMIYTAYHIDVYKVFKGHVSSSTINLITEGGRVGSTLLEVTPGLKLNVGETGIFFMNRKGKEQGSHTSHMNSQREVTSNFLPYASAQGFIRYDRGSKNGVEPFNIYKNIKAEIYDVLQNQLKKAPNEYKVFNADQYLHKNQGSRAIVPVITSFSPDTLTAGTFSILTINGTNFGASYSGSASVFLRNADDGGATYYGTSSADVVSWSNTQIKIYVFNRAGTGTFKVQNPAAELSAASGSALTVTYNISQLSNDSTGDLINDSIGGYVFQYNVAFKDSTPAVGAFERTIEAWRCATYVNWMIADSTTTADTSGRDNINLVTYDNNDPLSAGVLGTAYSFYSAFGCGAWYVAEVDIKFNDAPSGGWYYGVAAGGIGGSQSDFESVALHEMGHAHQIGHVINNGSLMHYALTSGTTSRVLDPDIDIAAGSYIMTRSAVLNACGPDTMSALNAGNCALCATVTTSMSKTDATCNGGSDGLATVTPLGGTSPYTFVWNSAPPQFTATAGALQAGAYSVTVTDSNGCSAIDTISISEPAAITISLTKTDASCRLDSNGTATAVGGGGVGPLTYSWKTTPPQVTATAIGLISGTYTVTVMDSIGCFSYDSIMVNEPTELLISLTKKDATCNGYNDGSAMGVASGATSPYSYLWNTIPPQADSAASALIAGTYTVTVTDSNSCVKVDSIVVNEPSAVSTSMVINSHVMCFSGNDGSATVTPGGGTPGYTYVWSTVPPQNTSTGTGLSKGKYYVTVQDAFMCSAVDSVMITEPTPLVVSLSKTDVTSCGGNDGTATATASGSILPYTYSWNTAPPQSTQIAVGLTIGTYTVTVTDSNSCVTVDSIVVNDPSNISVTFTKTNALCSGSSDGIATAAPSGGIRPYTYLWNTIPPQTDSSISGLSAGAYIVTTTDSNTCFSIDTVTISEPTPLGLTTSSTSATAGNSDGTATVAVLGATPPYLYSWNTTPTQTTSTATGLAAGPYVVTVSDNNDCQDTAHVNVSELSVVLINQSRLYLELYPNPVKNILYINFEVPGNNKITASVYNFLGVKLTEMSFTGASFGNELYDFRKLTVGNYFIKISIGERTFIRKIFVSK